MATIKDVAKLSGVSVSTVSIILNGQAKARKISEKTQKNVLEAIKELNYNPSVSARRLRSSDKEKYTVGVYWAIDFTTGFLARFIEGLQMELLKSKLPVSTVICPFENNKLENESGLKNMSTYNAVIIANTNTKDQEFLNDNPLPIPAVLINRHSDKYHTVRIDNVKAGEIAAEHIYNKGITDIGMVIQQNSFYGMQERGESFLNFFKRKGIEITKERIISSKNSVLGGTEAGEILLKSGKIPRAVFVDSDVMSQGLIHFFNKNGIKVPEECEVISVGIGPTEISKYFMPSITVVDMPLEEMAAECIKLISEILEHNIDSKKDILLETKLMPRESSPL